MHELWTGSTLTWTYGYDSNSNRTSLVEGSTTSGTYDAEDRLLTYGPYTYTHNLNGERTLRTKASSVEAYAYSYNGFGNLKQVVKTWDNGGTTVTDTYAYLNDAFGNRIQVSKNGTMQHRYIYDEQGRLVAELNASGNLLSRFVYGVFAHAPEYMIKSGTKYRLVHDQLGSVVRVVNSSNGTVASSLSYDEFGRVTASSTPDFQPFGFAGGLRDSVTGLVRFGARDYDPEMGRWLSKDPILFGGGDVNLYGYVMSDPIDLLDPRGLKFTFGDSASQALFNNLLNNPALSAANRTMLDTLERSDSVINVQQGGDAKLRSLW